MKRELFALLVCLAAPVVGTAQAAPKSDSDRACRLARDHARDKTAADVEEAERVARSKSEPWLVKEARETFDAIPASLLAAGREHLAARVQFDLIDRMRESLKALRMSPVWNTPCDTLYETVMLAVRREQAVQAEIALDGPDYDADRRLSRATAELGRLATAFAAANPRTAQYDRAFAWDASALELRLCMPPVSGRMLDLRFCATFNLETGDRRYGVHQFASYPVRDPEQSDQVLMLDLGAVPPARFVASKKGHAALYARFLKDETPDDCQAP